METENPISRLESQPENEIVYEDTKSFVSEPSISESLNEPADAQLSALGLELARNRFGSYAVLRNWYAAEMYSPCGPSLRRILRMREGGTKAIAHAADLQEWLFLDVEAAKFGRGTDAIAFLIGVAWWDSCGIHLEQFLMRDIDEEHSILFAFAQQLRRHPVLVTFNGSSFDWPLLQRRIRMTRQIRVPQLAAHLDFLHPARRLWRRRIGSVCLADLEQQVLGEESLGWSRSEDIDRSRIAEYYFQFVRGTSVDGIAGVLRHNRMDLRGLAALANAVLRRLSAIA